MGNGEISVAMSDCIGRSCFFYIDGLEIIIASVSVSSPSRFSNFYDPEAGVLSVSALVLTSVTSHFNIINNEADMREIKKCAAVRNSCGIFFSCVWYCNVVKKHKLE